MSGGYTALHRTDRDKYAAGLALYAGPYNSLVNTYRNSTGRFPSNTQIWFVGKSSEGNFSPVTLDKLGFGNTAAPKGHFILNAFDRNFALVSGINTTPFESLRERDLTRPSCVESAFGRIWYSGTQDSSTQGIVYFSAIVNSTADLECCYQQNDPTAEELSDLLDSDGGAVLIMNAGKVVALKEFRNGILAFATNGVWYITSGTDTVFKATNYVVEKLTDIGALGRDSVVSAEGAVFYWSDAGIYAIAKDNIAGAQVQAISQNTIQSFYNDISSIAKKYAVGKYSSREKKVIWIYKDDSGIVTSDSQRNKMLTFDMNLGAFFPSQFTDGTNTTITGLFLKGFFGTALVEEAVVVSGEDVVVGSEDVVVSLTVDAEETSATKFVGLEAAVFESGGDGTPLVLEYGVTFYELTNTSYSDPNGSFPAYVETNNIVLGELLRNKQAQYVFTYFNRTEDGYELDALGNIVLRNQSSCLVSAKWDWTSTGTIGRWSDPQQAYRLSTTYIPSSVSDPFDYDYDVIKRKMLIRGKGRALRLRFEAETGKGFELLGWAMPITAEATP